MTLAYSVVEYHKNKVVDCIVHGCALQSDVASFLRIFFLVANLDNLKLGTVFLNIKLSVWCLDNCRIIE